MKTKNFRPHLHSQPEAKAYPAVLKEFTHMLNTCWLHSHHSTTQLKHAQLTLKLGMSLQQRESVIAINADSGDWLILVLILKSPPAVTEPGIL